MSEDGSSLINDTHRKLWALTYECLSRYGVPVMHEFQRRDITCGLDQQVIFYVPRHAMRYQEVKAYLVSELQSMTYPGSSVAGVWIPGANAHVLEFAGFDYCMTAAEVNNIVAKLTH